MSTQLEPGAIPGRKTARKGGANKEVGQDRKEKTQGRAASLLVAPTLIVLAIVILYPVLNAVYMSFQQDEGLDPVTGSFVAGGFAGFANYIHWLFQQCETPTGPASCPPGTLGAQFWSATGVTFFFTVVTVFFETVLGFWMAVIMARAFRGRTVLRAAVLVPWAIPTAVTAKLWFFIFAFDGIANSVFQTDILWTGSQGPAQAAIIIADVWKTTPFMALLILAGLQMIPAEVYEAAKVDGASAWQRFRLITLPLVKPALMVAILFRTLDALRMYDLPAIMTNGANGTTTLSILVVQQIRVGFNAAAALSTITFLIIFIVAFIFVRFLGANAVESASGGAKGKMK
ncbi:carbohydrate ABC transporter permease [Arthrobacter glacialis]|uniref:ABC transporter permease n=1 Tax=Arthrobacter glacialis TaxID=1664 RepID=A0A2S3ZXH0_ARTGL|nr:sugar ABC transporter permease [Arthrobacter glacialis]POH59259.1 ABC transporter permease [Arthrobacter glacialis]POH73976.1 ABC transporter permease [Arthrobacter glacialis]